MQLFFSSIKIFDKKLYLFQLVFINFATFQKDVKRLFFTQRQNVNYGRLGSLNDIRWMLIGGKNLFCSTGWRVLKWRAKYVSFPFSLSSLSLSLPLSLRFMKYKARKLERVGFSAVATVVRSKNQSIQSLKNWMKFDIENTIQIYIYFATCIRSIFAVTINKLNSNRKKEEKKLIYP